MLFVASGVECRDPGIYDNTTTAILMLLIVVVVTSVTASVMESREQIHISNQDDGAVS